MINAAQLTNIKALGYEIEPDDEAALIDFLNLHFPALELEALLRSIENLLGPCSTPPELKKLHFLTSAEPWFRIQFYSANYGDETQGLALGRILRMENGKLIAEHEYLVLPEVKRGQGIGKQILGATLEHYERIGVHEIRVWAGIKDGPVVWALAGFKALDKSEMDEILRIAQNDLTAEQYGDVKAVYDLYYNAEPTGTAFPIKDWTLLGFMDDVLKQVHWHGRVDLTNDKELRNFREYVTGKK